MKKYILLIDNIGKTKLELSIYLKAYNIEIIHAKDETIAMAKLFEFNKNIKLIMWDLESGDDFEFDTISNFKNRELLKKVPLVIISPFKEKKYVVNSFKAGATEYIIRPFNEKFIIEKLDQILGLSGLLKKPGVIEESYDDQEKIQYSMHEILSIHLKGWTRGKNPFSILLISLVNASDKNKENRKQSIELIIKILKVRLRETDILIKYGAENILILLPFTDKEGANMVENKIWQVLGTSSLLNQKGDGLILASSIVNIPDDGSAKENLITKLHTRLQPTMFFGKNKK